MLKPKAVLKSTLDTLLEKTVAKGNNIFKTPDLLKNLRKDHTINDKIIKESGLEDIINKHAGDKINIQEDIIPQLKNRENTKFTHKDTERFKDVREGLYTNHAKKDSPFTPDGSQENNYGSLMEWGEYSRRVIKKESDPSFGNHFDEPNYYSHYAKTDIKDVDGTRIIHELQSDVHGKSKESVKTLKNEPGDVEYTNNVDDDFIIGRIYRDAYNSSSTDLDFVNVPTDFDKWFSLVKTSVNEFRVEFTNIATESGKRELLKNFNKKWETKLDYDDLITHFDKTSTIAPIAKLVQDKKYLENTVNKVFTDAFDDGKLNIAFRIGRDKDLHRSDSKTLTGLREQREEFYENKATDDAISNYDGDFEEDVANGLVDHSDLLYEIDYTYTHISNDEVIDEIIQVDKLLQNKIKSYGTETEPGTLARSLTPEDIIAMDKIQYITDVDSAFFSDADVTEVADMVSTFIKENFKKVNGKLTIPAGGAQKFYEKDVYKMVMKSAKAIGAKTSFDGNYLKVALPAAGFSLSLYASEGEAAPVGKATLKSTLDTFFEKTVANGNNIFKTIDLLKNLRKDHTINEKILKESGLEDIINKHAGDKINIQEDIIPQLKNRKNTELTHTDKPDCTIS